MHKGASRQENQDPRGIEKYKVEHTFQKVQYDVPFGAFGILSVLRAIK